MGGEYPKRGGDIPGGDIRRLFVPRGRYSEEYRPLLRGGESPGGGQKSCDNGMGKSSTFLKIISCPPPNMSLPLKCPPPQKF